MMRDRSAGRWKNALVTQSRTKVCGRCSPAADLFLIVSANVAGIIECAATGELRAYRLMPVSPLLDALMFSQQDIQPIAIIFEFCNGQQHA